MLILGVIEKLSSNLQNDHPLDNLAMEVGMSTRRFTAAFRAVTGFSVYQYLANLRMLKAAELLSESNKSIITIAKKIGYKNKRAFCRKFKSYTGMKPIDYRRHQNDKLM